MTSQSTDMPLCACGCGEQVSTPGAKWKRGHFHRGENTRLRPLPATEDEAADELEEEIDLGEPPELPGQPWDGNGGTPEDFGEIPSDEPPADLKTDQGGKRRRGAPRVTATIRKDIQAKISLGLEIPGRIWQARDPYCGGTFIHQRPAIAEALTDIVCDSADLVDWFTGPAGGFMKYLKLAAAVQPVAVVVYGHHVTHTIGGEDQDQPQQQDMSRYAA